MLKIRCFYCVLATWPPSEAAKGTSWDAFGLEKAPLRGYREETRKRREVKKAATTHRTWKITWKSYDFQWKTAKKVWPIEFLDFDPQQIWKNSGKYKVIHKPALFHRSSLLVWFLHLRSAILRFRVDFGGPSKKMYLIFFGGAGGKGPKRVPKWDSRGSESETGAQKTC